MPTYLSDMTTRMLRALDTHTGGMVALVPAVEHLSKLSQYNGVSPEQLHITLAYLGDAGDWSAELRTDIQAVVSQCADQRPAPRGNVWAVADLNPNSEDCCAAFLVGGIELETIQQLVRSKLSKFNSTMPAQHVPWVPHLTVGYGLSPEEVSKESVGDVLRFSALRVAFAGSHVDFPFSED